jgi:hypothetical protein
VDKFVYRKPGTRPKPQSAGLGISLRVFSSPKLLSRKSLVYFLYTTEVEEKSLTPPPPIHGKMVLSDSVHNFPVEHIRLRLILKLKVISQVWL